MDSFVIEGGARLEGTVEISGAKNAALPILAASLLASGRSSLNMVPDLADVRTMGRLLGNMGAKYSSSGIRAEIDTSGVGNFEAPYDLVKTMRASVLVLGPLLARYGRARVSLPGGCAIGARPVNLHITGLKMMGADIRLEDGYIIAEVKRLKGAKLYFDIPTVTGTENLMMAATLAEGTTLIENAAREPEIINLAEVLGSMGARIKGAGEGVIEIQGVDGLSPYDSAVIPDRIECGTFMAASALTGGDIMIKNAEPKHLEAVILKLKEAGVSIDVLQEGIRVRGPERPEPVDITTSPYPGFPTDMQAQFMALMCLARGSSVINERIFENRFMHVAELRRMGANITEDGGISTVKGVSALNGAEVMATDLRASASLVLASLRAKGPSTLHRVYHLDRGYDRMELKLRALGADVRRLG